MEHRKNKRNAGFTLLEALVAITILAFGLMAIIAMVDVSQNAAALARNTTRATEIATWMIDRVIMETSLDTQPYTTDLTKLRSLDNDPSPAIVCDTAVAADPANEPGRTICREWRALIRPNLQNAATALPDGRGELRITPEDPAWQSNHTVEVLVSWQTMTNPILPMRRRVLLRTMLANAK